MCIWLAPSVIVYAKTKRERESYSLAPPLFSRLLNGLRYFIICLPLSTRQDKRIGNCGL